MTAINPTTGRPLSETETLDSDSPSSSGTTVIQRCLFQTLASTRVHVYNIPPLASNKGHDAAAWTATDGDDENERMIFTARLRVLETAITPPPSTSNNTNSTSNTESSEKSTLRADILLEDPSTGALFASCPYVSPASVMQALGSSRFFALRVVGEGGMKATLGIGFEERADAFDFNTTLQDVRKLLGGFDVDASAGSGGSVGSRNSNNNKQAEKSAEKEKFRNTFLNLSVDGKNGIDSNNRIKVDLSAAERMRARNSSAKPTREFHDNSENSAEKVNKKPSAFEAASLSNQAVSSVGIPFLPPPPPPSSTSSVSERTNRRRVKNNNGESITNNEAASKGVPKNASDADAAISSLNREHTGDDDDFGDFC